MIEQKLEEYSSRFNMKIEDLYNLSLDEKFKLIDYVFSFSQPQFYAQIGPELLGHTPFDKLFDPNGKYDDQYVPFRYLQSDNPELFSINSRIYFTDMLDANDYVQILTSKQLSAYKDEVVDSQESESDFIDDQKYSKSQLELLTNHVLKNVYFNKSIKRASNEDIEAVVTALNDGYNILQGNYNAEILKRQLAFMQTVNPEFLKTENKFRLNEILLKQQIVKPEQLQLGKWGLAPGKKAVDDLPSNAVSISFNLDAIKYYQNIAKQILENKPIETDGSDPAVCCINFNDTNFALIKLGKCFDSEKFDKYSKLNLFCDFDYDSEYDLKLKIWEGIANIKNSSPFSILDDILMEYDDPEYLQVIAFGDTSSFAEEIKQLCIGKLKELGFVYDERVPANNLAIVLDTSDIDNIEKFSLTNEQFNDLFEPDYSISYIPESEDDSILVEASCEDPTLQKTSGHYKKIDRIWVVPKSDLNNQNTELLDYVCYNSMDDVLACTPMKKSELGKIFMSNQQEEPKKAKNINIHVSSSHSHG